MADWKAPQERRGRDWGLYDGCRVAVFHHNCAQYGEIGHYRLSPDSKKEYFKPSVGRRTPWEKICFWCLIDLGPSPMRFKLK